MITPSFGLTATERVLPKLTLDFTTASLDPRVTFTRTGNTATVTNSSGNIALINADLPRFDYNPVTLACKGLLIEETRTNIATYSEDFNTSWSKTRTTVVTDQAISPDGTQNADLVYPNDNSTALFGVRVSKINFGITSGQYTNSVYVKSAGWRWIYLLDSAGNVSSWFDVQNGVLGTSNGNTTTITSAGNGWYRCSIFRATTTTTGYMYISFSDANNSTTCTASGTNGVYLWGGQLELGAFPTSYIPNIATGGTTRNADVATISGTNFSSFWQVTRGGALVRALPSTVSGTRPLVRFDDSTADNIIALRGNTTNPELYIRSGGVDQATIDAGTISAAAYRLAGTWAAGNAAASVNSYLTQQAAIAALPVVSQLRLGSDGTNYLNGHLQSLDYYNSQFSNANLQFLTSAQGYNSTLRPVFADSILTERI